jgi:hypothetical protein
MPEVFAPAPEIIAGFMWHEVEQALLAWQLQQLGCRLVKCVERFAMINWGEDRIVSPWETRSA